MTESSNQKSLQAQRDDQLAEILQRMDADKRELQEQVVAVEQRLARIEALLQALVPKVNH